MNKTDHQPISYQPVQKAARGHLARAWRVNRPLLIAIALHLLVIPFAIGGWLLDPKTITGMQAWIKPLKFAISSAVYGATLLWLLTYVQGKKRWIQVTATVTGLALIVETVLITLQVVRGVTSHYNQATPLDGLIFNVMGGFIVMLAAMNLIVTLILATQRMSDTIFAAGIRWALAISLVGMLVPGFLMTSMPSPSQLAAIEAGQQPATFGAHSVGVDDGGPGLPFVGWSTEGGDLRVAHFVGLHGLQFILIAAWLLSSRRILPRLTRKQRANFVHLFSMAYLAWFALLTWQALRAQSIVSPDRVTLLGYGLIMAVFAGSVAFILASPAVHGKQLSVNQPSGSR